MAEERIKKTSQKTANGMTRRNFCNALIKRSSAAAAGAVTGYLVYKKPEVRSFFGVRNAYALQTAFTLNGEAD